MNMHRWKVTVLRMPRLLIQIMVTGLFVGFILFNYLGVSNPVSAIQKWYLGEAGWLIEQSTQNRESEDTDAAVEYARAAVRTDPNSPEAHQALAYALVSDGNTLGAKRSLDHVEELDPENPQIYIDRSTIFYNEGKFMDAIDELNKALAIQPDNIDILLSRAAIQLEQHMWDAAIADYTTVIEIDAASISHYGFINAYTGRAVAFLNKGMIKEAIPDFQRGLDLAPDAMYHRGKLPKLKKALTTLDPASDEYHQLEELIARIKSL